MKAPKTASSGDVEAPTATKADQVEQEGPKPYKGVANTLARIAAEEGIGALWKGVGPSLILVSNPSIQFVAYENVRKIAQARADAAKRQLNAFEFFLLGAIAKAVATVLTYPLQVAQSKLRADRGKAKNPSERNYNGTVDTIAKIYAKDGLAGLFRGMTAKLWQTVLTAAFQFMAYGELFEEETSFVVNT